MILKVKKDKEIWTLKCPWSFHGLWFCVYKVLPLNRMSVINRRERVEGLPKQIYKLISCTHCLCKAYMSDMAWAWYVIHVILWIYYFWTKYPLHFLRDLEGVSRWKVKLVLYTLSKLILFNDFKYLSQSRYRRLELSPLNMLLF